MPLILPDGRRIKIVREYSGPAPSQKEINEIGGMLAGVVKNAVRLAYGSKRLPPPDATSERTSARTAGRDYQNVRISGYLSTFGNRDRDGDTVAPGAFKDTLPAFMKNPVMLCDHTNSVLNAVGNFTEMREDSKGLWFMGELSNAPGLADLRCKVVEGHLRTFSMGGLFYYLDDGRTIYKVDLMEGSLCAIPANPQCICEVVSYD